MRGLEKDYIYNTIVLHEDFIPGAKASQYILYCTTFALL